MPPDFTVPDFFAPAGLPVEMMISPAGFGLDDYAAFINHVQSLATSGGGILFVGPGLYGFTSGQANVTDYDHVLIVGCGRGVTIFEFVQDNTRGFYLQNCDNFTVLNLTIRHRNVQTIFNTNGALVEFVNGTQVEMIGCEIYNSNSQCIVFDQCVHTLAENNFCHNSLGDGIHHVYCTGKVTCRNNDIRATQDDGISVNNYFSADLPGSYAQYGVNITGNLIQDTGPGRGILVNGGTGVNVSANMIHLTGSRAIFVCLDGVFGTKGAERVNVQNNICTDCMTNAGGGYAIIEVGELNNLGFRTYNMAIDDVTVKGNQIIGGNNGGIDVYSTRRAVVEGNLIRDVNQNNGVFSTGLQFDHVNDAVMHGNTIDGTAGHVQAAIYVTDSNRCLVNDNNMHGCALNSVNVNTATCTEVWQYGNSDQAQSPVIQLESIFDTVSNRDIYSHVGQASQIVLSQSGGGDAIIYFGLGLAEWLTRLAAGQLRTDAKLLAKGGIGIGNKTAGAPAGAITAKFQVFDENGVALGFVPIY